MNGRHLADRLTELRPAIKVLYLSGYASDLIAQYGVLDPVSYTHLDVYKRQAETLAT